jgi:hypothetical protein
MADRARTKAYRQHNQYDGSKKSGSGSCIQRKRAQKEGPGQYVYSLRQIRDIAGLEEGEQCRLAGSIWTSLQRSSEESQEGVVLGMT